jgi:hypothetical protein
MSILRYFNKHHGWYGGARTPFTGAEEAAALPVIAEVIEGGAVAEGAVATGTAAEAGAGAYEAGLAGTTGNAALYGAGQTGATYAGAGAGELATEEAAQEAARQAAMQNAGNSQLANVPANQFASGPATSDVGGYQSQQELVNQIANARPEQMVPNNPLPPGYENLASNAPANTPYDPMQASQEGFKYPGDKGISSFLPSQNQLMVGGGLYALNSMMNADRNRYSVPAAEKYTGPLNKMRYNPDTYQYNAPVNRQYTPNYAGYAGAGYAEGGITQLPQDKNFAGGGMYPGSQIDKTQYSSSPQTPMSMQATMASYDPETNPLTGEPTTHMASGGIAGLLKGRGDGMSDSIHATIADKQPARLADGEFVIPADVVSHLGNGSTDAGAKHLYKMMDKVRHARTGSKKQGKQIAAGGYLPIK